MQGLQIAALPGRARLHGAPARANTLALAVGAAAGEANGGVDVGHLDRKPALQPLVKTGDGLVSDRGVFRCAGDRQLVAAGAQLHIGELLDAHEMTVVMAIEHCQQRVVVERHAAHIDRAAAHAGCRIAHAAASQGRTTISPARLLAWPSVRRTAAMLPISRGLPSA